MAGAARRGSQAGPGAPPRGTGSGGLNRLTSPASPKPSQRPTCSKAPSAAGEPASASRRTASTSALPPPGGCPARRSRAPAPPAVPGHPGERLAIDDQATADADFSGDEQDVVHAHGRPPPDLGQRADVRLVGDGDGRGRVESSRESLTRGGITPPEVRCPRDEPVGAPD